LTHFLHGADYYPEQWDASVWLEDVRLMKKAGINAVSLGIFAWSHLEPEEGRFDFDWMDNIVSLLGQNNISIILATPSGARPPWLAQRYPEVLRVDAMGIRNLFGQRENHCLTSPVFRQKVALINSKLSQRYGANDSVILWHISNEYNGACHCELCQQAFRKWLQKRYETLSTINTAWNTSFWSHRFTDWEQIHSPTSRGDSCLHGLRLAWRRFVSEQTIDFYKHEVASIREYDKETPATTNFHLYFNPYQEEYYDFDYFRFAQEVDVVSWDCYPLWHSPQTDAYKTAATTALLHDMNRSMKKERPFLLMESAPGQPNWHRVNKLKRPGMHLLTSIQAIAHGSDSVQYFQWRKSRGGSEKLHSAVVDHGSYEVARVFKEVGEVGKVLRSLRQSSGTRTKSDVALVFDWENRWGIEDFQGYRNDRKSYVDEIQLYHRALWEKSISTDCIDQQSDLTGYKLLIAPILYLLRPGFAERLKDFVASGGVLVTTYCSGLVDQDDAVFRNGQPGPLQELLGLWVEEADALYDEEEVLVCAEKSTSLIKGKYKASEICERIHLETAKPLARYGSEFYSGEVCLSQNSFGKGIAYYVAFRADSDFVYPFIQNLSESIGVRSNWPLPLPSGVNVQKRSSFGNNFLYIMNFNPYPVTLSIPDTGLINEMTHSEALHSETISSYGIRVLRQSSESIRSKSENHQKIKAISTESFFVK